MQLILYTCSMLSQIFLYCWYGNEVKLRVCRFKKKKNISSFNYLVYYKYKYKKNGS